jgi:hypothetical protein
LTHDIRRRLHHEDCRAHALLHPCARYSGRLGGIDCSGAGGGVRGVAVGGGSGGRRLWSGPSNS